MAHPETPSCPEQPSTPKGAIFEENHRPWFVWTLILAPCLMPTVWNYHVKLTEESLSVGYSASCARRKVDRSQIRSVEVIENIDGLCEWGGYGIRKQLPSWETGYIARNGPGVRMIFVDTDGKEKPVTFSCFDPEKLVNIIMGEQ